MRSFWSDNSLLEFVPSSARLSSSLSAASPLPTQLEPPVAPNLQKVGHAVDKIPEPQAQAQVQVQPPTQPRPPPLDLDRIYVDLYGGKDLARQHFINDIHNMVNDAAARVNEDLERLQKAQAMLIAADVSMRDFDARFKLECQRMAECERKRRDESMKGKNVVARDVGQSGTSAPGTSASARRAGRQPEMSITHPPPLEKRARSGGRPGGSPESSEESRAEGSGQPKKRPRTMLTDENDRDSVDTPGPTPSQRPNPPTIRRADDELPATPNQSQPPTSTPPPSVGAPPTSDAHPMVIDAPAPTRPSVALLDPSCSGSNPLPLPSLEEDVKRPVTLAPLPNGTTCTSTSDDHDVPIPPRPRTTAHAPSRTPTVQPPPDTDALPSREPTRSATPLPEFHVDNASLLNLQHQLRTRTRQLSVEQLEQLRARCISSISQWDFDSML